MQDLTKDVFRIDAIPSQSLDTVREWLSSMDVKFYENKVNLNWKAVLKSIIDVSPYSCGARTSESCKCTGLSQQHALVIAHSVTPTASFPAKPLFMSS